MRESKREQARKQGRVGEQPESISQKRRGGKKSPEGIGKKWIRYCPANPRMKNVALPSRPHGLALTFLAAGLAEG